MKNYEKMLAQYIKNELSANPGFREEFEKVCKPTSDKRHTALKKLRATKNKQGP